MTRLDEILDECLKAIEAGQNTESILARYPDQAEELRRMVAAAGAARAAGSFEIPGTSLERGRVNVLRRAADMRIAKTAKAQAGMKPGWRLATSLALVFILVATSTRLVSASSGALPGDQLYPVKRSWESLQLFFVFQEEEHQVLQSRFTQERLDETSKLLVQGRSAPISFSGLVMQQQDGTWLVSGIRVVITPNTLMPARSIGASEPVTISGITRSDGTVVAEQVQLLDPGVALPPLEPSGDQSEEGSGSAPSVNPPATTPAAGQPSGGASQQASYQFTGVVGAMQGLVWVINGQSVHVDQAQITGTIKVGSIVTFEGYYSSNGVFEVTQVNVNWTPQVRSGSSPDTGKGSGGSGGEGGSNDTGGDN